MSSTQIREIHFHRTLELAFFKNLDLLEEQAEELRQVAHQAAAALGTRRVWMLNSTAQGGGVAEMLPRLCNLLDDLGIDCRWLVLEPAEVDFFQLTKLLHNMIHGEPGFTELEAARRVFERTSQAAARTLRHVDKNDILVVHDPQPLGVASYLMPELRPTLVWRCHIGTSLRNQWTARAWELLRPYLEPYQRLLFSGARYIPEEHLARSQVIWPGIDPLSHKNRELRPYKLLGILRAAGLLEGASAPGWARFPQPVKRFVRGSWEESPIPGLLLNPLILQVSRFDRLKGFAQLIPAFERVVTIAEARAPHLHADLERLLDEVSRVQLVLAGPDPEGVADDPEGSTVLDELCRLHQGLPGELAERVQLLRLPMGDPKANALTVNALQRLAQVVVQLSLREGFGLTAAEALWKGTPVVATNVGGLAVQIRHGTDGLLVDDPHDAEAVAQALLELLAHPKQAEGMASSGRGRVREHFLVLSNARSWLRILMEVVAERERPLLAPAPVVP